MLIETILLLLLLWNLIVFFMYGLDKRRAIKDQCRIPEKSLISAAFLMGGAGALLGMRVFRHKTKHRNFPVLIPLALALNLGVMMFAIYVF